MSCAVAGSCSGQTSTKKIVLEQEIGEYGTGLNNQQSLNADNLYENTFQDDPGHISRAEIRFNAALKAAGGEGGQPLAQARAPLAAAPSSGSGWAAYPVLSRKRKAQGVTVNIVEGKRGREEHRHGMSASEARGDLESYFSSLGNQLKAQERKHAQQILNSLSSSSSSTSSSSSSDASREQGSGGVPRQERTDQKLSALMKLVEKAAHSQKFQRALVGASKGKFRQSLVGDFE